MSEPIKQPKRSKRRPAMEPLGWDEIVSQPGMGGYLSFLNGPVPLPHLQGSPSGASAATGVVSDPVTTNFSEAATTTQVDSTPELIIGPEILSHTVVDSTPDFVSPNYPTTP